MSDYDFNRKNRPRTFDEWIALHQGYAIEGIFTREVQEAQAEGDKRCSQCGRFPYPSSKHLKSVVARCMKWVYQMYITGWRLRNVQLSHFRMQGSIDSPSDTASPDEHMTWYPHDEPDRTMLAIHLTDPHDPHAFGVPWSDRELEELLKCRSMPERQARYGWTAIAWLDNDTPTVTLFDHLLTTKEALQRAKEPKQSKP